MLRNFSRRQLVVPLASDRDDPDFALALNVLKLEGVRQLPSPRVSTIDSRTVTRSMSG
jgi:hypothetical protein